MYRMIASLLKGCLGALILIGAARAELPPAYQVVLLTENFPPFNMSADGKNFARGDNLQGINSDIVREMFKRADIDYNLTLRFPWDRIYTQVLEKPDHGIFSTTLNDERKPLFKWVGPLSTTERVLVAAPGTQFQLNDLQDAARYRIGAYKSSSSAAFLDKNGIPYEAALRDQENAKRLISGHIDLWATNDPVFRYYAAREGVTDLQVAKVIEASTQQYLALNLQTPDEVVQRLQAALDEMRADGTVERISQGYLGGARP